MAKEFDSRETLIKEYEIEKIKNLVNDSSDEEKMFILSLFSNEFLLLELSKRLGSFEELKQDICEITRRLWGS